MFRYLSDSQALYLFDSGRSQYTNPFMPSCRTLLTLSPLERRYKEFEKQKGAKVCYMPLYDKEELIAIGLDMLGQDDFPVEMKSHFTAEEISTRYEAFGGVIRNVLPHTSEMIDKCYRLKEEAARNLTPEGAKYLLDHPHSETSSLSHTLVLLDVPKNDEGEYIFTEYEGRIIDPRVIDNVRETLRSMGIGDIIALLIRAENERESSAKIQARL
eukprot:scaffold3185_cov240-Ochromonas_danica.AAC.1